MDIETTESNESSTEGTEASTESVSFSSERARLIAAAERAMAGSSSPEAPDVAHAPTEPPPPVEEAAPAADADIVAKALAARNQSRASAAQQQRENAEIARLKAEVEASKAEAAQYRARAIDPDRFRQNPVEAFRQVNLDPRDLLDALSRGEPVAKKPLTEEEIEARVEAKARAIFEAERAKAREEAEQGSLASRREQAVTAFLQVASSKGESGEERYPAARAIWDDRELVSRADSIVDAVREQGKTCTFEQVLAYLEKEATDRLSRVARRPDAQAGRETASKTSRSLSASMGGSSGAARPDSTPIRMLSPTESRLRLLEAERMASKR